MTEQMQRIQHDLLDLAEFAFQRLRHRVEGMTDDEYFWEPAPGCWSIRAGDDGTFRRDGAPFPVKPAPLTTIAWRLTHVIDILAGERNATWIGATPSGRLDIEGEAASATEAIDQLDRAYALFRGHVAAADAAGLTLPLGPIAGPYAESTRASFVLHELDELIHHGAEIAALRDIYRATRPVAPIVDACRRGDLHAIAALLDADPSLIDIHPDLIAQMASANAWDVVRRLVDHGFDVSVSLGVSALHYAVAADRLDSVDQLIDHGADLSALDTEFGKTPAEWADHLGHDAIAKRLRETMA
jgi:hypothetical protein